MTAYELPIWWILPYLFVLGAVVGSWLNVCIYRIPRHERLFDQLRGLASPPSSCPGCGQRIHWYDNVPIIGWIKLGGRCRTCRMHISPRYPIIEFCNGLIFAILYWYEIPGGFSATMNDAVFFPLPGFEQLALSRTDAAWLLHGRYFYHLVLIEALLVASMIDLDLMIIPDASTLPAMTVGVVGAFIGAYLFLVPLWWQDPRAISQMELLLPENWSIPVPASWYPQWIQAWPHLHGLLVSLAGLVFGGAVIWGVRIIGRWMLREEVMGFGDVILMAMIGSFIGWQPTLIVFFIAPLCALTVVLASFMFRRRREVPYGPYLSFATLIVLFGWKWIWPWWRHIFDLGVQLPFYAVFSAVLLAGSLGALRGVKKLLGFSTPREEWIEEWTPADQLLQFAGNKIDEVDRFRQMSTQREWSGLSAARGTLYQQRWRDGSKQR